MKVSLNALDLYNISSGLVRSGDKVFTLTLDLSKKELDIFKQLVGKLPAETAGTTFNKLKNLVNEEKSNQFGSNPDHKDKDVSGPSIAPVPNEGGVGHISSTTKERPDYERNQT